MTARHDNYPPNDTYLEIYRTRTPQYERRPSRRLYGVAVALTGTAVAMLVLAPDRINWLTQLVVDTLARLP